MMQTKFAGQSPSAWAGAEDGSRTHMVLLPQAPETCASAISPLPHICLISFCFKISVDCCASFLKLTRLCLTKIYFGGPNCHYHPKNLIFRECDSPLPQNYLSFLLKI